MDAGFMGSSKRKNVSGIATTVVTARDGAASPVLDDPLFLPGAGFQVPAPHMGSTTARETATPRLNVLRLSRGSNALSRCFLQVMVYTDIVDVVGIRMFLLCQLLDSISEDVVDIHAISS